MALGQNPPVAPVGAYTHAAAVTPGAGALAGGATRALYVGTAGSLTVTMAGDAASVVFGNVGVGLLPIAVTHVTAAGASNIVALY